MFYNRQNVGHVMFAVRPGAFPNRNKTFRIFSRTAQVEETPEVLLALAAANRLLDAPQWQLVEDKCRLHELLKAGLNRV